MSEVKVENETVEKPKTHGAIIGDLVSGMGKVTLVIGISLGLIVGATLTIPDPTYSLLTLPNPMRYVYGLTIMASSFVSGIAFLGLGEVVTLLEKIRQRGSE
ncbi:hypothetical protein LGK95_02595 [Clostridium algoriphilum]|uniref:hypothetical protein n=1 Tax=Clostridium algoriphilum TaxID=198347 RepID=UPI001CF22899|nr:hypothetical protein [Clostridium algoriphilum]MCB2292428.1 hypothetical protein [Clostridium algoriphilum]